MEKHVKKRGLGKGLGALLSDTPAPELMAQASTVPISKIQPNRYQPRTRFADKELKSLTESVRRDGVLMPILLRPHGDDYELIAGERRWRAAQAAGLPEIPAIVRDVDDLQALELAIIENEQRDDLTAIESARAYQKMMDEFGCTQQQVANRIGISRVQVSNMTRLLQLPEKVQKMIENRELGMGHARPLVGLPAARSEKLAVECVSHGWSARQMEQHARQAAKTSSRGKSIRRVDPDVVALQDELTRTLGLPVEICCKKSGAGEMRIRYTRPAELDGVLSRLRR
ncbi:MAG: ParB/RepB/Spo0J family partition protein [Mariprofundaceae bacterium]|nr:ParB/RepB/Spo0J family partition protein [Mariprofundaceae bacterium]